mmetsp:Transcript_66594/g.168727  ORF Transcript_66594/g.168727 Transcript_66594/m.168727 type:complete len:251 (-) Transcript_66594:683-1435(-)
MMTSLAKDMSPSTTICLQSMSEGGPFGISFSMASVNLYMPSNFTSGGMSLRASAKVMRKSFVRVYASERSAKRSFVVFTGAKRERGMTRAVAPSKHWMAAPMAVSSCSTLVEALSRGSTVLAFFMTGRGMEPPFLSKIPLRATRSTHKLLVLKNLYLVTSWKAFSSSSGHCADSRSSRPPVAPSLARWPPFLSASVRVATSIMKGALLWAKYVRSFRSMVAPKLSELDTNMYLKPLERSLSRVPEPNIAG